MNLSMTVSRNFGLAGVAVDALISSRSDDAIGGGSDWMIESEPEASTDGVINCST